MCSAYFKLAGKGRVSFVIKVEATYNLISCRWYDNKCVQLISNYIADTPVSERMRWCRKEKIMVKIPHPAIVDRYNRNMGGVDLSDMLLELYKVNHRSKKWYMRIGYWCINVTVVNSWLLYRRDHKQLFERTKHMPRISFQLDIAKELLNANVVQSRKRGRSAFALFIIYYFNSPSSSIGIAEQSSPASSKGIDSPKSSFPNDSSKGNKIRPNWSLGSVGIKR